MNLNRYPLFVVFLFLQMLDFSTTYLGVKLFGAHETNPVGIWCMHHMGLLLTLVLFKSLAVALGSLSVIKHGDKGLRIPTVLYSIGMAWNCYAIVIHVHNYLVQAHVGK